MQVYAALTAWRSQLASSALVTRHRVPSLERDTHTHTQTRKPLGYAPGGAAPKTLKAQDLWDLKFKGLSTGEVSKSKDFNCLVKLRAQKTSIRCTHGSLTSCTGVSFSPHTVVDFADARWQPPERVYKFRQVDCHGWRCLGQPSAARHSQRRRCHPPQRMWGTVCMIKSRS